MGVAIEMSMIDDYLANCGKGMSFIEGIMKVLASWLETLFIFVICLVLLPFYIIGKLVKP